MTKSSITEQKIKEEVANVEQQYAQVQQDIANINKQGEALSKLLNQKLQEALGLKGQYKALVELLPKKSRPSKPLPTKPKK